MSIPSLRQPNSKARQPERRKKTVLLDIQYVIVTLKDQQKLVVTSDAYHGIITVGDLYKCVFCHVEMKLDLRCKEKHTMSTSHMKMLEKYPHVEEYSKNLIRELTKDSFFCTICNVVVGHVRLIRHLCTEVHRKELEKAEMRADNYKPY